MAAAAADAAGFLDVSKNAKIPVHLSSRLTNPTGSTGKLSSVTFNHKPSLTTSSRSTTINSLPTPPGSQALQIIDADKSTSEVSTYKYRGRRSSLKQSFALIYDPPSQSFTLEPMDSTYNFNLTSAPWEQNRAKLAQQYPQLDINTTLDGAADSDQADDLFDEGTESEGPDPNNPFDYRHYLNRRRSSTPETPDISRANTPMVNGQSSPATKPAPSKTGGVRAGAPAGASQKPLKARPSASTKLRAEPLPKRQRLERASSPLRKELRPQLSSSPPQIRVEGDASSAMNTQKLSDAELDSSEDDDQDEEEREEEAAYSNFEIEMDPETGAASNRERGAQGLGIVFGQGATRSEGEEEESDEGGEYDQDIEVLDIGSPAVREKRPTAPGLVEHGNEQEADEEDEIANGRVDGAADGHRERTAMRRKSTHDFDEALQKELKEAMGAVDEDEEEEEVDDQEVNGTYQQLPQGNAAGEAESEEESEEE